MIPLEKIKKIVDKYKLIEKELASGEISKEEFVKKSKEYSSIGEIVEQARSYLVFEKEKKELEKITEDKKSDKEMIQLAKNELNDLIKKNQNDEKILKVYLLPKDEADTKNAISGYEDSSGDDAPPDPESNIT